MKPGETSVPELAQFKAQDARLIHSAAWGEETGGKPQYVSGERMILFLRDAEKPPDDQDDDERQTGETVTSTSRWKPSNPVGTEMKYSTVWLDRFSMRRLW